LIDAEKANFAVTLMCEQLDVTRGGYYAWKKRQPSERTRQDEVLKQAINTSHERSRGTYGSPRIVDDLKEQGFEVGRRRVARLMREEGLTGTPARPYKRTTDSKHNDDVADNLLERDFAVDAPNKAWATDITYVRTWQGWMYLAVVIDLFSRRVVGWATATHMRTELALDALSMALGRRVPDAGLLHHSDRGSQYTSSAYRDALQAEGIVCSMSTVFPSPRLTLGGCRNKRIRQASRARGQANESIIYEERHRAEAGRQRHAAAPGRQGRRPLVVRGGVVRRSPSATRAPDG
jgi:putative transposase